ncbi:MAG: EutN/CcmL family microcompartment protein [Planctomycetota bacterium]
MLNARVEGIATATVKHPSLEGRRMVIVQAYGPDGVTPDGDPLLAVDAQYGAGVGQDVVITSDGAASREVLGSNTTPVRWTVLGVRDA